eukprot:178092-Prorocentrum_minimum.AAC.1
MYSMNSRGLRASPCMVPRPTMGMGRVSPAGVRTTMLAPSYKSRTTSISPSGMPIARITCLSLV